MKKRITSLIAVFSLLFVDATFAGSKFIVGPVSSMYQSLTSANLRPSSTFSLIINNRDILNIEIADYYSENGYLSIVGKVAGTNNSTVILKGTKDELYANIAIHDTHKAYEYTTVGLELVVEEVLITKIVPDYYEEDFNFPPKNKADVQLMFAPKQYSPMAQGQLYHIGPYKDQDVTKLESRPGSKKVFFMDIYPIMNGNTPKYVTKDQMYLNWQCAADQYSMYDINVTTNKSVYQAAGVANSGIMGFVDQDGRSFASLNSFGTTNASTVYRNNLGSGQWGYGVGRTAAHEGGHQMGLNHDGGGKGGEYYEGIPAYQWCPTMGNFWYGDNWNQALYQWSKGEYSTATNKEDDLTLIKRYTPYLVDDISGTKAMVLGTGGAVSPKDNWGIINASGDADVFTFSLTNDGHLKLQLDPIEFIGMLDIDARILDASGTEKAQSNLPVNRSASFDLDLPAGSYKLEIKGGAEGTPSNGFSTYASMGYYAMEGTITGSVGIVKTDLDNLISIFPNPTSDRVYFNFPTNANITRMSLTTPEGKMVYDSTIRTNYIDLSSLTQGIYILKIEANNELINRRIAKF